MTSSIENMTNEEIIKKSIEKAIKNGYRFPFAKEYLWKDELLFGHTWWAAVIFSVAFAKSFWGEKPTWWFGWMVHLSHKNNRWGWFHEDDKSLNWSGINATEPKMGKEAWEYHLQQMVLEENPLKYLERYL